MASREEIEQLRDLARKRHRAVTQKVSRLKRNNGVEISGTKKDPRKDPASFKKMNSIQLKAHINRLDTFVSRETSWVRGAGKTALLTGNLYHQYEALRKTVNRKRETPWEGVKDIFIPSLGVTVGEFQGEKPSHPVTGNPASRAPHLPILTTNKGIPNDKQLKKLIGDLKKQLGEDYGSKVINRDRKIFAKFLKDISKVASNEDLDAIKHAFYGYKGNKKKGIDPVERMSPAQFAFLWNYTNFADAASFDYEIAKSKVQDPTAMAEWDESFNTQIRHMKSLINDVRGIKF